MFRDAQQNGPSRNRPESNNDYEGEISNNSG